MKNPIKCFATIKNIQAFPKDIANDIDKLQNRWSDELDIHAEPWSM